jgi:hypothetical protein
MELRNLIGKIYATALEIIQWKGLPYFDSVGICWKPADVTCVLYASKVWRHP